MRPRTELQRYFGSKFEYRQVFLKSHFLCRISDGVGNVLNRIARDASSLKSCREEILDGNVFGNEAGR